MAAGTPRSVVGRDARCRGGVGVGWSHHGSRWMPATGCSTTGWPDGRRAESGTRDDTAERDHLLGRETDKEPVAQRLGQPNGLAMPDEELTIDDPVGISDRAFNITTWTDSPTRISVLIVNCLRAVERFRKQQATADHAQSLPEPLASCCAATLSSQRQP